MTAVFIVHIHFSDKPGVCYWLRALDGSVTPHAALAIELHDTADAHSGLMALANQKTLEGTMGFIDAKMHHFTPDLLPPAIRQLVRLD